jgi:hypothetical protein
MSATRSGMPGSGNPETRSKPATPGADKPIVGWAAHRLREYEYGSRATWLEKRILEYANPVHFALAVVAGAGYAIGLWTHDWLAIAGATLLVLFGHAYCWTRNSAGSALAFDRQRSREYIDRPGRRRAGSLVQLLSRYGRHGRARCGGELEDRGGREGS